MRKDVYLNRRIIFMNESQQVVLSLLRYDVGSKYKTGMNLVMPGGASLYSLSVAWFSNLDPLMPKVWHPILGFVLVLLSLIGSAQ